MPDTRRTESALLTLFADNTAGDISAQDGRDLITSVHGEKLLQTDTYANRPASPVAGDLFLPTNSYYLQRYSGSAWASWGPVWPMTPPVDGDYSWDNQTSGSVTATVTTTNGGIYLDVPANGSDHLHVRYKSAPAAPYTITAYLSPLFRSGNTHCGFVWRQSSDGKLITFGFYTDGLISYRFTNSQTYGGVTNFTNTTNAMRAARWLRLTDDNTNRLMQASLDGYSWTTLFSEGRTTYITADQAGFYGDDFSSTGVGLTVHSWKEA